MAREVLETSGNDSFAKATLLGRVEDDYKRKATCRRRNRYKLDLSNPGNMQTSPLLPCSSHEVERF
jgi:hypothetical protein